MAGSDDTANEPKSKTMQAILYYEANKHDGVTPNAAAVRFGISAAAVYRKLRAIKAGKTGVCPLCGQPHTAISHKLSQKKGQDEH